MAATVTSKMLEHETLLLRSIRLGDLRVARTALERQFASFSDQARPQSSCARALEMLALMSRAAIDAGAEPGRVLARNDEYVHELLRLDLVAEMHWMLRRALMELMKGLQPAVAVTQRLVGRAAEYLRLHYCEPDLNLQQVARAVHVSPAYLSHLFRRESGVTLTQSLTELRVTAARQLLADTGFTLADIAARVGYSDVSYFCKLFKRCTQEPPGAYRRRVQAEFQQLLR